ncbi:hypothetical protein EV645_1130 [Kribbella rubisoli]|uniref:Uncharacterized protein n=1 Tax=Kribbella rubisoli TaxID=3075929 RepID=A0A4Q7X7K4_9ACTN|nr:hypothetical protein [Kribbella rubisoli]RZU18928.1 hypothetical protein EV645_1130 [Kribbella rubisoli]
MTTPTQESPAWPQGSWMQSGEWLAKLNENEQANLRAFVGMTPEQRTASMQYASLDSRQQANLMRAANTDPLRDRVNAAVRGAVARVHLAYDNTQHRLSEAAQTLATQAREYRDAAVGGATRAYENTRDTVVQAGRDVRDTAVQAGRDVRAGAEELGQRAAGAYNTGVDRVNEFGNRVAETYQGARESVVDAAQRGQVRLDQAWQAGADRLNETGQQIAQGARDLRTAAVGTARDTRDAVVGGARTARDAVAAAPGKVGRWFEGKFNNTMLKAESSLASFNAGRHNPPLGADMNQAMDGKTQLAMIQQWSENLPGQITVESNEAIQNLAQASQAQIDAQNAARLAGGVAPASQAVGQPPQPQTAQQGEQTGQPANLTKNNDKGGLNR